MMMCLGVFPFGSNLLGTLWASWTSWKSISFGRLGKFSFIICSNKFSVCSCCSSLSGTPINSDIGTFQVVPEVPKPLFIFLNSCFFLFFWMDVYFFCSKLLLCVLVSFLSLLVPWTFGFISLRLFFLFLTKLNQICEHFDYQGFELSIR